MDHSFKRQFEFVITIFFLLVCFYSKRTLFLRFKCFNFIKPNHQMVGAVLIVKYTFAQWLYSFIILCCTCTLINNHGWKMQIFLAGVQLQ